MFCQPTYDPYAVPGPSDDVVRVEFPEDASAPGDWVGLVLYEDGAAPIEPEEEGSIEPGPHTPEGGRLRHIRARRELLALSRPARVGSASCCGAVDITAYAAVDPETRVGYVEVWIINQDRPVRARGVCDVVTLRRLLREALQEVDDEAVGIQGVDPTDLEIEFHIPKEMPPRRSGAKKSRKANAPLTLPRAKRLVRELMARGTLTSPEPYGDIDEAGAQRVADLVKRLRRGGYPPRLETRCHDYEYGNFSVGAMAERRLYFGRIPAGRWEFSISGEAHQFMTGLMIETDTQIPILPEELFFTLRVDFDDYGDFPATWDEVLERSGYYEEDDDDEE